MQENGTLRPITGCTNATACLVNRLRNLTLAGALLLSLLPGSAADWYVDADVASNGDGRSWTAAWRQLTDIVWSSVNPGDTIWVSGGHYYGVVTLGASGRQGSPIRLKKAQSEGHNDMATLHGSISSGQQWFTIDGAKDDSYTNQVAYTYQVHNITNNIGFKIDSRSQSNQAINVFGSGPNGLRLLWLEVTTGPVPDVRMPWNAIRINAGDVENCEIAYCWLHDTNADGVSWAQDNVIAAHSLTIHHNLIERIGDDGIVFPGGATIHHNIVRDTTELYGHPDGIVGMANHTYIYNNIVYDWNTQPMYPSLRSPSHANFFVYGNLVYSDDLEESQECCALFTVDGSFPWRTTNDIAGGWIYTTNAVWENVIIANNTFIAGRFINDPVNLPNRYSPENRPGEPGLVVMLSNWVVKNNIFYGGKSMAANFKGSVASGMRYSEQDFVVQNNLFHSAVANGNRIMYGGSEYYANAEAMDAATASSGNRSNEPLFVNAGRCDFRLSGADTAARGKGQNLSSLNLPGIEYDVWGNYRGDGAWDIGAIAYSAGEQRRPPPVTGLLVVTNALTNGLLLHLTFEDDFVGNGFAADTSGNGAHLLRYGWVANPTTNFPTATAGRIGAQAAAFLPYYDSHPYTNPEFNDGQYGAITNVGRMTSLTQATFAAWVKFTNVGITNNLRNHNGTILNAGYGVQGAWHWGRYYSSTFGEPQFLILTNTGAGGAATARVKWPQVVSRYWYTNEIWQHLAVTVDCTTPTNLVVKLYTDGANVVSESIPLQPANAVSSLRITDAPGSGWGEWIAVGCWTHNGNPELYTTGVPNNGWLNGALDDIRIYNRVLTAEELRAIYSGH